MTYKEQHLKFPTNTHFSIFTEKYYPYVSYIYTIKCKESIHFKPMLGKTEYFPIKNYLNLHFELQDNTKSTHQFHIHTSYKKLKIFLFLRHDHKY